MERLFSIGKIVNTQGIKGDVRVVPTTDDIKRFEKLNEVILENESTSKNLIIKNVRYHKNFVLLKFEGIDDMTNAEKLKGFTIKIPESQTLKLSENEYYMIDLIDMDVYTDTDEHLGKITDILQTGANDVYIVKKEKEILIPAIKQCILNIDINEKKMIVKLLEGLR